MRNGRSALSSTDAPRRCSAARGFARPRGQAFQADAARCRWRRCSLFVLTPVLLLQLYFSFHQWTVYLGSWWDAEFVGLDMFRAC